MIDKVRFTIVTSTFGNDRMNLLDRCVGSVVSQQFNTYRHFVIHDGGDLEVKEMCKARNLVYGAIPKYRSKSYGGPQRNLALEMIESQYPTDYIIYLDDDNYFLPHAFSLIDTVARNNCNPEMLYIKLWYYSKWDKLFVTMPYITPHLPPRQGNWDTLNGCYRADAVKGLRWNSEYVADFFYAESFWQRHGNLGLTFPYVDLYCAVHT